MLLWVRKAEPTAELLEILGASRGELTGALGRLAQAGLVSHHRPEGAQTHWFATAPGRTKGEALHRALAARPAEARPGTVQPEAEPERGAPADHERLKTRRRVSIDQNEKTGFSWD